MDGDWALKETSPGHYEKVRDDGTVLGSATEEEVRAWQKAQKSNWTLVEYRPGRYAKVAPDGAVMGKASEAEIRAWFAAQSKKRPRSASSSQKPDAPAPEPNRARREAGIHAWFAAQTQERQIIESPPSDDPAVSTTEEVSEPGIRDWFRAQKREPQPDPRPSTPDRPAVSSEEIPGAFQSHASVAAGDKGASLVQSDVTLARSGPPDAETHDRVQVWDTGSDPGMLQADLVPAEANAPGPGPEEFEPVPAAVLRPDLRQIEPAPGGAKGQAAEPGVGLETDSTAPRPEAVQLAFIPAVGEGETDGLQDGKTAPDSAQELALAAPPPPSTKVLAPQSRTPGTMTATTPEPDEPEREVFPAEAKESSPALKEGKEVKARTPEMEPRASESMPQDSEELTTGPDIDEEDDTDWIGPGTPPSDPAGMDQVAVVEPGPTRGTGTGGAHGRAAQDPDADASETLAPDVGDRWLWVDPRQERGYDVATFDLTAFLRRAAVLFRTKAWTGGREPARLAAHPDEVANGLKALAETLGLEVVSDPRVTAGTYRLGLTTDKET